ncbi:MAG: IS630 transposase-related protein [Nitrososphaerota archaeon]|nr:IS630 transposase-related protein [Nitrososphaerota archaeon]
MQEHFDAYLKELARQFNCRTSSLHYVARVKLKITRKNSLSIAKNRRKKDNPSYKPCL